jgi:EpsD family peptidyl-prolyl cis-trans isomerase
MTLTNPGRLTWLALIAAMPMSACHRDSAVADGAANAANDTVAARRVATSLVDEELLMRHAVASGLDRDPVVLAQLERGRRQVLAQAYAQKLLPTEPINGAAIEEYYRNHPGLFADRRIYRLATFWIPAASLTDALRDDLDRDRSPEQVRQTLLAHGIDAHRRDVSRPAEQLPLDQLQQYVQSKPGDLLIAPVSGATLLQLVEAVEPSPMAFEDARPMIEQYLLKERNARALQTFLKHEKTSGHNTYSSAGASESRQPRHE